MEHGLNYYRVADALNAVGYACYAVDHIGHGLSDGDKAFIYDYTILASDFVKFVTHCRSKHSDPNLPVFIVAHSLGTVITINAIKNLPFVKAIVFSGCALTPGPGSSSPFGIPSLYFITQTNFAVDVLGPFLASVAPKGDNAPVIVSETTSDEEQRDLALADPRRYHKPVMNKTGAELLKLLREARKDIETMTTPFLALHGGADTITYPKSTLDLMEHSATPKSDKDMEIYPGLRHEIFNEKKEEREKIVAKVVAYIEGRFAGIGTEDVTIN